MRTGVVIWPKEFCLEVAFECVWKMAYSWQLWQLWQLLGCNCNTDWRGCQATC